MTAQAEAIINRVNMIKRLNKYIVSKIMGIRLRPVVAVFLGGFAGLSLTSTILPTVISVVGFTDDFSARLDLASFAVYAFMVWALGGWMCQHRASAQAGALILGMIGLVSATVFAALAYGAAQEILLICAAAGLAYGTFGGLLIAVALGDIKKVAAG